MIDLNSKEYSFLNDKKLNNIILLGLCGSRGYGTNTEKSDYDLRGIALNSKREVLLGKDFEQVVDTATDTVVYSFNRILKLLTRCNPNTIELLGVKDYAIITDIGKELINNRHIFFSKMCINSFGRYAENMKKNLYAQVANNKSRETIAKTSMHIIRIYVTGIDLLNEQDIIVYRQKEHNLLMNIRNAVYLDSENKPNCEFWEMLSYYREQFKNASLNTKLPDKPDIESIENLQMKINEMIIKEEI